MTKNNKHNEEHKQHNEKQEEKEIVKEEKADKAIEEKAEKRVEEKPVKEKEPEHKEKVEEKTKKEDKAQEYLLMAQKIQAEFENYRKRTQKAEKDARKDGIIEAVKKFLPVLDSFDMAQKQMTNEEFLKANSMIINQLNKALEDLGVKKIDAKGKKFDHNYHNAIMMQKCDDMEAGFVVEVFQEGYMLDDKVIRYSVVKVSE